MKLFRLFLAGFLIGIVGMGILYHKQKPYIDYPEEIKAITEDSLHPVPMEGFRLSKDTIRVQFTGKHR